MTAQENLEEEIKENIEFLETSEGDEHQCITIENLEGILGKFFNTKVNLKIK